MNMVILSPSQAEILALEKEIFLLSEAEILALKMEILGPAEAEILADSRYRPTTHWQCPPQWAAILPFSRILSIRLSRIILFMEI